MTQEAPDQQVPALDELHAAFAGPLFMFAYRQTGDRQAAEEIVQDTLVTAWQRADRFDPRRGSLAGWLFTIARNRGRDLLRRRAVRPGVGGEPEALADPQPAEVDAAIEAWELAEALARLSPEHRAILQEGLVENTEHGLSLSAREIAPSRSGPPW